jgi:glycosyltransferase involved in cell wall biosynthesis
VADDSVSVGIPAHDNASTIGATIASLRGQSLQEWDCFVSCDSPSTDTYDAARAAIDGDSRFTLSVNRERPGVAANWNETLDHSSGALFKLLCADDVLYPTCLEVQRSALVEVPGAVLCAGRRRVVDAHGKVLFRDRGLKRVTGPMDLDGLIRRILKSGTNPVGEPSFVLYRSDVLRQAGGFSTKWRYTIDLASYVDSLKFGPLVAIDGPVGEFRVSSSSWSAQLASQQGREMRSMLEYALGATATPFGATDVMMGRARVVASALIRRTIAMMSLRAGRDT